MHSQIITFLKGCMTLDPIETDIPETTESINMLH